MAWSRSTLVLAAGAAAAAGVVAALVGRRWFGDREDYAPALSRGSKPAGWVGNTSAARQAGPEAMRDPPRDWGAVDEASDESFPASDPPPVGSRVD